MAKCHRRLIIATYRQLLNSPTSCHFAGSLGLRRGAGVRAAEAIPLASKSASIYNPPNKPQLPIGRQYPRGVPSDATGRITHDNKGRELVAKHIVGRRSVGGADEALSPAELDAVAEEGLGRRPEVVAAAALRRGTVGKYDPKTGWTFVYRGLPPEIKDMVAAHEVSHGLDHKVGEFEKLGWTRTIPITKEMRRELKTIYNDLNNSQLAKARAENPDINPADVYWGTGVTPKTFGYRGGHVDREYLAEGIRAAMNNPNYVKTVGPKFYAQLADFFNAHPQYRKIISSTRLAAGLGVLPLLRTIHRRTYKDGLLQLDHAQRRGCPCAGGTHPLSRSGGDLDFDPPR